MVQGVVVILVLALAGAEAAGLRRTLPVRGPKGAARSA